MGPRGIVWSWNDDEFGLAGGSGGRNRSMDGNEFLTSRLDRDFSWFIFYEREKKDEREKKRLYES